MNLLTYAATFLAGVGVTLAVILIYRAYQRSDFVFSIVSERDGMDKGPEKKRGTAPLFAINTFLTSFVISTEKAIRINARDLDLSGSASLLRLLRGVDFETIRLRLRIMRNLNPVVNREQEEGVIRMTISYQDVEFRVVFAAKGESILIEKQGTPRLALQDKPVVGNP